jgi:pimeloyl-ACP methyl ester carboxylesterase
MGEGPPLVKTANWLNHLDFDLQSPVWRHWFRELSRDHRFIRYDERGCGLSDWDVTNAGLDAWLGDLEAVVDAAKLDRFPLLGMSQGGPVAIAYAVRHPERVTRLVLYGTYARGWARRRAPQQELDEREAMLTLTRLGWGRDLPAYRELFTQTFIPGATDEQRDWFNELQRITCSPENSVALQRAMGEIDVDRLLPQVSAPTLVLHARGDLRCSFAEGQRIAQRIPDSHFVELESNNHLLLENEPAWPEFLRHVRAFLGVSTEASAPIDSLRDSLERSLGTQYSVNRELGGGGMSRVFVAHDRQLNRDVVVKILHAEVEGLSVERFAREMKLAASLLHPNIVPVLSAGVTGARVPYYIMPFIRGASLRERMATRVERTAALEILRDVAAALEYAHAAGIVHRDIKPENVLLSEAGAMVADFGIAKAIVASVAERPAAETLTMAGTALGTPAYMAPEQVAGEVAGTPADIYAWGMLAYELLTGQHPFAGKIGSQQLMVAQMLERPPAIADRAPDLPSDVAGLVMRCLQKDPGDRPAVGREVHGALRTMQVSHGR